MPTRRIRRRDLSLFEVDACRTLFHEAKSQSSSKKDNSQTRPAFFRLFLYISFFGPSEFSDLMQPVSETENPLGKFFSTKFYKEQPGAQSTSDSSLSIWFILSERRLVV
jgi:hypothetical protein